MSEQKVTITFGPAPNGAHYAAAGLRLAAEDSDHDRAALLLWLADQIDPPPPLVAALDQIDKRGRVIVSVAGEAHEIRAEWLRGTVNEVVALSLDDVRLLARMDGVLS